VGRNDRARLAAFIRAGRPAHQRRRLPEECRDVVLDVGPHEIVIHGGVFVGQLVPEVHDPPCRAQIFAICWRWCSMRSIMRSLLPVRYQQFSGEEATRKPRPGSSPRCVMCWRRDRKGLTAAL